MRPYRLAEGRIEYCIADFEIQGEASLDQLRPIKIFIDQWIGVHRWTTCHALHFLAHHVERCSEDRFMCDAHRGCRLCHSIEIDEVGAIASLAIRRADDQRLADRMPAILLEKGAQGRFSETGNKDGLVV